MEKTPFIIKIAFVFYILVVLAFISSRYIWITPTESLFYKIQQYATYDKEDWKIYAENEALIAESKLNGTYVDSDSAMVITEVAVSAYDYYPSDTNRLQEDVKAEEIEKIKNAHFERLELAPFAPSNIDAQTALVQFTQGQLTDVIMNQKVNIKIGTCYTNPNTDGNYACVSCMIVLYNRDTNDWVEAPMGNNFMENAYDFYQASEGSFWEAKDLSMMIPYDYDVFKKYSLK